MPNKDFCDYFFTMVAKLLEIKAEDIHEDGGPEFEDGPEFEGWDERSGNST